MNGPTCFDSLDDAALDELPFGVVRVSADGTVERFNRAEASRVNLQRWRVLGRNYFRDVAGANAAELAAYAETLAPGATARVHHTFRGYHREDHAVVELTRMASGSLYLCIRAAS